MDYTEFTKWLHEVEGFGLRSERLYDELINNNILPEEKEIYYNRIIKWLKSSYEIGYKAGQKDEII